jgi:molybdopterin molybdotransferase
MAQLLPFETALDRVLERVTPLEAERTTADSSALGRVLAEDATASVDLPPFASSAMDGFAVRAADTPGTLPVSFRIAAGHPAPGPLSAGEAMGIATGGVVPDGADAVIPIEYVVDHDNTVEIPASVEHGANVRESGSDVRAGDVVFSRGNFLGAGAIGALAAAGIGEISCARQPLAAVIVTGSELELPGAPLRSGGIYDANTPLLAAQLHSAAADVRLRRVVADDEGSHHDALVEALAADVDVVLTSGGVSVGPHDLVRATAARLGVEEVFWGVAVRPGKPLFFGVRDRTLVFGLPGNPVSSLVGFELFVRPALRALQGAAEPGLRFEVGTLGAAMRRNSARDQFVRARIGFGAVGPVLEPLSGQESHMIARAAQADALVLVRRGDGELAAGEAVQFLRLA